MHDGRHMTGPRMCQQAGPAALKHEPTHHHAGSKAAATPFGAQHQFLPTATQGCLSGAQKKALISLGQGIGMPQSENCSFPRTGDRLHRVPPAAHAALATQPAAIAAIAATAAQPAGTLAAAPVSPGVGCAA